MARLRLLRFLLLVAFSMLVMACERTPSIGTARAGRSSPSDPFYLPQQTSFQVTSAIVELKPDDPVLNGNSIKDILSDFSKANAVAVKLLALDNSTRDFIRVHETKILKPGENLELSYDLPKANDTGTGAVPYLRHINAKTSLVSVDKGLLAEVKTSGNFDWYADLMKTNHSTNFGGSIPAYGCFNVGTAFMWPLFVQDQGSAWVVVSVNKSTDP